MSNKLYFKFLFLLSISVLSLHWFLPSDFFVAREDIFIERAPKLPTHYTEPYQVKSYCNVNRGNSSKIPVAMSNSEHASLMETLRQISRLLGGNNVTWMMSDGSMVGSIRHWDVVPWDDDFDIIADIKDYDKVLSLLNKPDLKDTYGLGWNMRTQNIPEYITKVFKLYFWNSPEQRKFGPRQTHWQKSMKHKWPTVDLFFYTRNETHLWYFEETVFGIPNFWKGASRIPLDSVFPLQLRPMGYYWFPAPKKPLVYLDAIHPGGLDTLCKKGNWNHRWEIEQESTTVNCSDLKNEYFFVNRECNVESFCTEKLVRAGHTLAQFKFDN